MLHAVMVGVSESYLGALAVELGHGDAAIALLVTVPLLCGALAQLLSEAIARRVGRRRLVALGAAGQALAHLALYAIVARGDARLAPLLAAKIAFWTSGMVIAPAWSTWMAELTERIPREVYFARRSALASATLLVTFWFAGHHLESGRRASDALGAFSLMFVIGLIARGVSAGLLLATPSSEPKSARSSPSLVEVLRTARLRTPAYLAAMTFGTYLAAPFFTPYMLRDLALDFERYAILIATATLAKTLSFSIYHRLAIRYGLSRVLVASGIGVASIPFAWAATTSFGWLLAAQAISGMAWSGLEYASFQLLLSSADDEHRFGLMGLSSAASGVMQVTAGLIGSALLPEIGFGGVFIASGVFRALALVFLWRAVRREMASDLPRLFVRIVGMRPVEGVVRRLAGWEARPRTDDAEPGA